MQYELFESIELEQRRDRKEKSETGVVEETIADRKVHRIL